LFLFFFNLCSFSYFSEKLPLEYRISHNDVLVSYFKGKISQIFPFLHQFCRFLVSPIILFFSMLVPSFMFLNLLISVFH
jgi:hypothetical protein